MGLTVRRTGKSDYSRHIKALIVGPPGSGKTLMSSTWKNPLIASAEGGLMSIADRNIPYVDIRDTDSLFHLKLALDQDPDIREQILGFPVDTLVIDTIDEVQKIFVRERLDESKKEALELRDWGWLGEQMRSMIRGFRNLNMNVVMTCHVKESSDSESGRIFYSPALQGAVADELPGFVDLALLLRVFPTTVLVDGESTRVLTRFLQTYPDLSHPWIKDRSGKLPSEFTINFTDDYQRMYDLIYGSLDLAESEAKEVTHPVAVTNVTNVVSASPAKAQVKKSAEVTPEEPVVAKATIEDLELRSPDQPVQEKPAPKKRVGKAIPKDAPQAVPVATNNEKPECDACGGVVESEDQADLSQIRFRKTLCRDCFIAAKTTK